MYCMHDINVLYCGNGLPLVSVACSNRAESCRAYHAQMISHCHFKAYIVVEHEGLC